MGRAHQRGQRNGDRQTFFWHSGRRASAEPTPHGYKLREIAYILLSFYKPLAEKRDCEKSCRSNRSFINYRFTKTSAPLPSLEVKSSRPEGNEHVHSLGIKTKSLI